MTEDRFRSEYRPLQPADSERILRIKAQAEHLAATMELSPPSRELSLALTKLEEAVMWATKAITV